MLRVIAGKYKNKKLIAADEITRPLTDRIKTSIFDILREFIPKASVLDLFAGSGAFAIEALSRGALAADLVEKNDRAIEVIRQNLKSVGIESDVNVIQDDVFDYLLTNTEQKYQIIMVDPPFSMPADQKSKIVEQASKLLSFDGVMVFRYPASEIYEPGNITGLETAYQGNYGESRVVFLHNLHKA
jgi:16S rRNA (guanine966-N2)-methyltransferase